MKGGGFHFHFNGSLQAYQEARVEAEAGTVLPPTGEQLPDTSVIESEQPSGVVDPELEQDGRLLEIASEDAEQQSVEKQQAQAVQAQAAYTQAETADKTAQTMASVDNADARQQAEAAMKAESEQQSDQLRQSEAARGERNGEQLTQEQKAAERSAQTQFRDQQIAAEAARQQQANGQQNREQQVQQQIAQSQQEVSADQQQATGQSSREQLVQQAQQQIAQSQQEVSADQQQATGQSSREQLVQQAQQQIAQSQQEVSADQQQATGQSSREQLVQQAQQQIAQSQPGGSADQQRAAMRSDAQAASRAEAVRQSEAVRQNETAHTVRATPAYPFPGEGEPAQPAIPASVMRAQARSGGATAGERGATETVPAAGMGAEVNVDPLRLTETGQPETITQPGAEQSAPEQPLVSSDSAADEARQPLNLQPQSSSTQSAIGATASTSSDGVLDAAVTANGAQRSGPDVAGGRAQAEMVASRADQVVQNGTGSNMGDEGREEQPSQRQDSQQAQAAAGNRTQSVASGGALPQQPFSLAQQQLLSPNWGRAMGERAIMMAQHGPRTAQIQLDPPELGAMQIRIHMQGGDQVSVSFTSPNPMVREALEQQMPRLREMFAEQGLNLQDSSVADQSSQQQSGQHEQARQGQPGGRYGQGDAGPNEGLALHSVKVGLVDYYA
jgi:flagellar hook-length control protein FliK